MNKKSVISIIIPAVAIVFMTIFSNLNAGIINANSNRTSSDSLRCKAIDLPRQDISSTEESELYYMREEEKLAHDFYSQMYEKWGLRPFYNIRESEERHTTAIKNMIDKYGLKDPVKDTKIGVFSNTEIGKLYNALIEQGSKSEIDALKTGAEIEELDIKDLLNAIKNTDNEDLKLVYGNLKKASENHLRAFMRNLNRRGAEYSPKHLDSKTFNEILNK